MREPWWYWLRLVKIIIAFFVLFATSSCTCHVHTHTRTPTHIHKDKNVKQMGFFLLSFLLNRYDRVGTLYGASSWSMMHPVLLLLLWCSGLAPIFTRPTYFCKNRLYVEHARPPAEHTARLKLVSVTYTIDYTSPGSQPLRMQGRTFSSGDIS